MPHTNIGAMVEVARRSPVPIATGESLSSKQQFADLLQYNVVSILQPEPLNLGGLFATRKICDMVDAHYGVVAPHSAQGPVCSAACAQLNASLPNFFIHEIFDEFNEPWEKEIVTNHVEVVDGYIEISERPGLGIDLNIEEILKHRTSRRIICRCSSRVGSAAAARTPENRQPPAGQAKLSGWSARAATVRMTFRLRPEPEGV